jgi:hypothetical protein
MGISNPADDGEGGKLGLYTVPFCIVFLDPRCRPLPKCPPRPVAASGLLTRLVFPSPPSPNSLNHEVETWHYRTETTRFPMDYQH